MGGKVSVGAVETVRMIVRWVETIMQRTTLTMVKTMAIWVMVEMMEMEVEEWATMIEEVQCDPGYKTTTEEQIRNVKTSEQI